jgi:hypothetical protein
MTMEKQKILVSRLLERTTNGDLRWRETIHKNAFQVSLKENSVLVRQKPGEIPDVDDYEFQLINNEGQTVDSFLDLDLAKTEDVQADKIKWYRLCEELYDLARRTALGSEQVLNQILRDLDDD